MYHATVIYRTMLSLVQLGLIIFIRTDVLCHLNRTAKSGLDIVMKDIERLKNVRND